MNPRFKYRTDIPYIQIEAETLPTGRTYFTPAGPASSVTTILGTLPHPWLEEWIARVGEEEAERIKNEAAAVGDCMHNRLEAYVRGVPYEDTGIPEEKEAKQLYVWMKKRALMNLREVWGIEVPLHLHDLYAGRCDLVGVYKGVPSIIDYKNSLRWKNDEMLEDYGLQIAAYALAHDHMFGDLGIKQGVNLIAIRGNPKYNKPPSFQEVIIEEKQLQENKIRWMEIVENFHKEV